MNRVYVNTCEDELERRKWPSQFANATDEMLSRQSAKPQFAVEPLARRLSLAAAHSRHFFSLSF